MSDASVFFAALADRERRRLLLLLCDDDIVRIPEDLRTRRIAAQHSDQVRTNGEEVPTTRSRNREIMLYHNHLPQLESAGLVRWDSDAETVSRGPAFGDIEPLLRVLLANAEELPIDLP